MLPIKRRKMHDAIWRFRSALISIAWLSALINVLLLGGPIYMMLIYDSVMPSGSVQTLFGLLGILAIVFVFHGIFDVLRSRILADVAMGIDDKVTGPLFQVVSASSLRNGNNDAKSTAIYDLDNIRAFLSGPGPGALLDLPWTILFLSLLFFLHIWLGVTAFIGAIMLILLTIFTDRLTRGPSQTSASAMAKRTSFAQDHFRNVETVHGLGMADRMQELWQSANIDYNHTHAKLARYTGLLSTISRVFRMFLQSVVLTVGALLYLAQEASGGIVFAASILAARALAPIDSAIANWAAFLSARQGWKRIELIFSKVPDVELSRTKLPRPSASLRAENLAIIPPGAKRPIVMGVDFELRAGDALGIVGPSAAGKTGLLRTLIGMWKPANGFVRLDGATLDQWHANELGSYFGYLPQQVAIFEGTIAENISRFARNPTSESIIEAASTAGLHEAILGLEKGYETQVGSAGVHLSAGQKQRIGLARALYGKPFLILLDEPNSNLDTEGEAALDRAIKISREEGAICLVIAHRPAALRNVNKMLVLKDGRMADFGERDEILKKLLKPSGPAATRLTQVNK